LRPALPTAPKKPNLGWLKERLNIANYPKDKARYCWRLARNELSTEATAGTIDG